MPVPLRIVGYIRVSTDEQAKEGVSLKAQAAKLRLHAELHELDLVDVVPDEGVSAGSLDRPGMKRVLDLLDRQLVDGVSIVKLDRLTRSLGDWSRLIDFYFGEKARPGMKLFSVMDSIDTTTATGRMMLNIIMTIAQWEREIIAERTKEALAHKIANRERVGKVRYGFALDESGPRNKRGNPVNLLEAATEQEAIALMKRLREDGQSLRAIAEALRTLGIETREGNAIWTPSTIQKILARAG
jgi:DNA invertase Pin-like site-specific DNA recombinase